MLHTASAWSVVHLHRERERQESKIDGLFRANSHELWIPMFAHQPEPCRLEKKNTFPGELLHSCMFWFGIPKAMEPGAGPTFPAFRLRMQFKECRVKPILFFRNTMSSSKNPESPPVQWRRATRDQSCFLVKYY